MNIGDEISSEKEFDACREGTVVSYSEFGKKVFYYFKSGFAWHRSDDDFNFQSSALSGMIYKIEWVPPTPPLQVGDVITTENIKFAPNLTVLEQEGIQYVKLGIWFYDKEDSPFEEAWFDAATVKYLP